MQRRTRDTNSRAKIRTNHQWPLSRQNHATTSDGTPSDSGVPPASTNEYEDHLSYPGLPTQRSRCPGSTTISDMLPPTAEKSTKIPAELKSKGIPESRFWGRCPPVLGTVPLVERVSVQSGLTPTMGPWVPAQDFLLNSDLPSWELSSPLSVKRHPTTGRKGQHLVHSSTSQMGPGAFENFKESQ